MAVEIRIPVVDETTEEVKVVRWFKRKGDTIAAGEVLLEVETDKAALEVESFADGVVLEILVEEGQEIPVNSVVAIVGDVEEGVSG